MPEKEMKILKISHALPPISGGAEKDAWITAKLLAETDDVHILTYGKTTGTETREGVTIHYLPKKERPNRYYLTLGRPLIKKFIKQHEFDIIHAHMTSTLLYCLRHANAKRILTFHHGKEEDIKRSMYTRIKYTLMLKSILKNMDAVTTVSKWHAEYSKNRYGVEVQTIPNGVDFNTFKPLPDVIPKENVVLFVGRFVEQKGISNLVEAAHRLPDYEFWFVGSGPLKNLLKGPNIKYLGFIHEPVGCYNKATICVFPSVWENLPSVGLEAMACGKPVIATKIGFSEYIEDGVNGILMKNNSVKQIVETIQMLMKDEKLREEISQNAIKTALRYDWHDVVKMYRELYTSLLRDNE